jgi:hypothetical protein
MGMAEPSRQFKIPRAILWGMLFFCLSMLPATAQPQWAADTEREMKAGFIYNFALFIEWPAHFFKNPSSPLAVCVAGDKNTAAAFDSLKTKKIKDRPVIVYTPGDNATHGSCHIIYIATHNKAEAADYIQRVSGPGILTIGNADGFCQRGGIINFYQENNKLRFEINTDAAQRAGLKLSSQLLKLARIIRGEKP